MRNELEVMRVIRVPPMGKLVVRVGNRRLESLRDVRDESVRGRLMAAIGELVSFAGGYEVLVETGVAPPVQGPAAAGEERPGEVEEDALTAEQQAFLASLEEELKATIHSGQPAMATTVEEATVDLNEPPPAAEVEPTNLVQEIDAILQDRVRQDPALRGRTIQLEQPLAGALQIRVDNRTYEHPNEIEEVAVRRVIKQALKAWEAR